MSKDDEDDRPPKPDMSDEAKRKREAATTRTLVTELLARFNIPPPDDIDEVIARGPVPPPPPPEPEPVDLLTQLRSRATKMLERGWPQRALDVALVANESKPGIKSVAKFDGMGALVLSGDVGRGKTVAAAWWAMRQFIPVLFVRAATLARTSRYDAAWSTWVKARALCIDDLGGEYADVKGSFAVDLDELVDTFYADKRALIITTNCKAGVFKQRYGARVLSRLSESGLWVNVTGESMRGTP